MEVTVPSTNIRKFIGDETGGYTVWSLIWFSLYVAMGGLAVDVTDAYRNRTLLQSTADAAALAGVMSLPDTADAVAQAVGYAENNMAVATNGHVVDPAEVYTGNWDTDAESFTVNGTPLNAVYVVARRAGENENPLATNFLRIIGLQKFDINVDAVAIKFVPSCLTQNGLVAANQVDVTSGNSFSGICIHGQNDIEDPAHDYAVEFNNGNTYGDDVQVSMPDLNDMPTRQKYCDNNEGICDPGTLVEGDMWPKDVQNLNNIIAGLTDPDSEYIPDYMSQDIDGVTVGPTVETYNENYAGPFDQYHIYDINCSNSNKLFQLPADVELNKVIIVADCQISSSSGGTIVSGILATSATGNGANPLDQNAINFASGWSFGSDQFCVDSSGQVGIYANASVSLVASTTVYGLRSVVGGNFSLTANADVSGISVEAGDSITATAGGDFTYCGGTFDDNFAQHYRLVR
jgi:Flp pilus assembly protein TadG